MYLIVLMLLETGMKSSELFTIKTSDVDISDPYSAGIVDQTQRKGCKKG